MDRDLVIAVLRGLEPMRIRAAQLADRVGLIEYCLRQLGDEDRFLLESLFVRPDGGTKAELMEDLGVSKTTFYRRIHGALRAFSKLYDTFSVERPRGDRAGDAW